MTEIFFKNDWRLNELLLIETSARESEVELTGKVTFNSEKVKGSSMYCSPIRLL